MTPAKEIDLSGGKPIKHQGKLGKVIDYFERDSGPFQAQGNIIPWNKALFLSLFLTGRRNTLTLCACVFFLYSNHVVLAAMCCW